MVAVLMSTYNGAEYLKQQIDSVLCQSYSNFTLYIRDDGSTDDTQKIIGSYNDSRIVFEQGDNLGPAGSFFALLNMVKDADYVFFSDQDDIWYPKKMEKMLEKIAEYKDEPVMLFTDFTMIDSLGQVTADSFSKHACLQVTAGEIGVNKIIAHPYAFGCASAINRALTQLVLDPPEGIEMHDCWLALTAASVGKLVYMPEQTIAHRFHSSNATGRSGQDSACSRLLRITKGLKAQVENTKLRLNQTRLLIREYEDRIKPESLKILVTVSNAMQKGKFATVNALIKQGVSRQKVLNTLFFYYTVFAIKGDI